ncbi:transglycosylase SLT domain-containing protein [Modestobacter sp. I12A-02628]|uniref:Transglycosylase SLT domain-containing protein n=1 Tax=Goekera deserti TaxID=2497753 RepID=A0A7K3WGQ1_9ACTN|nr:transglycosylase SLT domain-containing protein [Goekera deserti]MPQ99497.1 transglycosylase SLT domain-containing protein [Goekera deserti]NDI48984.1 transglycosylase SLT domain-containing protein [Goekera deserti]NEL55546.1 transglycosylase SLT domain-containing protein [Goekera deserti]
MDGLSAVQSRIGEIQARFTPNTVARSAAATWQSAATASGLSGSTASDAVSQLLGTGSSNGDRAVAAATAYLGVPYQWGGTDPTKGLDCSGLTQRVYADLGVAIPRTSSQQATAGTPVASLAEALPGDLVFFDNTSSRPGIDHVGIYAGNGKMIAAPQEGEVVKLQAVGTPTVIRRILPADQTPSLLSGLTAQAAAPTSATAAATAAGPLRGVPYADLFTKAATAHGISPALLAAVAKTESNFDTSAVSPAGAQGLMQFMPATARGLGVDPRDPASAIDGAARYLRQLTDQFGSTDLALAAYNAGPGTVSRHGGIPPYPETQAYVTKVKTTAAGLS